MSVENKRELLDKSLEQGIIDKSEYEKERQKLDASEKEEQASIADAKEKQSIYEKSSEEKEQTEEEPKSEEKTDNEKDSEPEQVEVVEGEKKEHKKVDIVKEEERSSSSWLWIAGIVLVVLGLSYCSISGSENSETEQSEEVFEPVSATVECSSDEECAQEKSWYSCENPGTTESSCVVEEALPVEITIIGDEACPNCDAARLSSILSQWFPAAVVTTLDASSIEGKTAVATYNVNVFPAAILGPQAVQTKLWDKIGRAFFVSEGKYVLKASASGSTWYGGRQETEDTLTLVVKNDDTGVRALANVQEFVNWANVDFTLIVNNNECPVLATQQAMNAAHCIFSDGSSCGQVSFGDCTELSSIAGELGVSSTPFMLINNKLRLDGVGAADSVKNAYCSLNDDSVCEKELTSYLI